MRLIDADALIQILRHDIDCYDTGKPDNQIYINAKDVENMINGQPTAYDVDKVVQQLEEKTYYEHGRKVTWDAAETVKSGGIE